MTTLKHNTKLLNSLHIPIIHAYTHTSKHTIIKSSILNYSMEDVCTFALAFYCFLLEYLFEFLILPKPLKVLAVSQSVANKF